VRALGIDVGVRKGLDLVLLDGSRDPAATHRGVPLENVRRLIEESKADVVAIDSPPGWAGKGPSRSTEREIRHFGIQSYGTPTADRGTDHPFYEWMRVGFEVFRMAARAGFPRYRGGPAGGTAIEVFPHASAVVLAGCLPPRRARKAAWRAAVLQAGGSSALGDPREGVIVLPARALPARPFRRCLEPAGGTPQPHLPRMSPCACGDPACDRLTSREFAPGHDARRKSMLWRLARQGHGAAEELRRRGWELPPEIR
jgi:predicted nuclease with RNAse H fold